jgi:hypothetical protein
MDTNRNEKGPLPDGPTPRPGGSTLAQLKNDIDMGRTGDRARTGDPGLSMLGTDDEAGGHPNSPELIDQMRQLDQARSHAPTDSKSAPAAHDQNQSPTKVWVLLAVLVIAALAAIGFMLSQAG